VVVERQQEGVETTTEEETTVVPPAGTHGREASGQGIPGVTGGELPEDSIQHRAGAVFALAGSFPLRRRAEESRATLAYAIMLTHDLTVGSLFPRGMAGEAPTVGGDEEGRRAIDKVSTGIGRDEGLEKRPLLLSEVGGQARVIGGKR